MAVTYTPLAKSSVGTATSATTASLSPASGTYLVVSILAGLSTAPTITDSLGGTWVQASAFINSGANNASLIWWRTTVCTGSALTITMAGFINASNNAKAYVVGAIGGASGTYSARTTANGTTTIPTLTTPTAVTAGDLYYAFTIATDSSTSTTAGTPTSGYSGDFVATSSLSTVRGGAMVQTLVATSTVTSSVTGSFTGPAYSFTAQQAIVIYVAPVSTATTGTGAVSIAGTATVGLKYSVTASGAINITSSGTPLITGTANIDITGLASTNPLYATTGSAAFDISGSGSAQLSFTNTASGLITLSGTASVQLLQSTGSSSITLTGSANVVLVPVYSTTATGTISIAGSVSATVSNAPVVYTPLTKTKSGSTAFTTSSITPVAGGYLIASVQLSASPTPTISDTLSGVWVIAASINNSANDSGSIIYLRTTPTNGSSLTISVSGAGGAGAYNPRGIIVGLITNSNSLYSAKTSASGTTTIPTLVTPTALNVGDLYYVHTTQEDTTTITTAGNATSGYSSDFLATGQTNFNAGTMVQYANATSATTSSITGSFTPSLSYLSTGQQAIVIYNSSTVAATGAVGLIATGTPNATVQFVETASAAITLSGSATTVLKFPTASTGVIAFSATGIPQLLQTSGTGSITLAGSIPAGEELDFPVTANASLTLSGNAFVPFVCQGSAAVGLIASGTAILKYPTFTIGRIDLLGAAIAGLKYSATASGSVTLQSNANDSLQAVGFVGWGIPL